MPYHEAAPHLVFMAYLQRIVNSGGRIDRKFAIGTGRADLVVEYGNQLDVIELKLWRAQYTYDEGIKQVSTYAKRIIRDRGYLIIFDVKSKIPWQERGRVEEIIHDGINVVIVWA